MIEIFEKKQAEDKKLVDALRSELNEAMVNEKETALASQSKNRALIEMEKNVSKMKSDIDGLKNKSDSSNQHDPKFIKLKYEQYKRKMICSICNVRDKEIFLPCFHMFCNDCIQENIDSRQRQCPLDRKKISKNDIKEIRWGV